METTKPMHPKYVALLGISNRVGCMCVAAYEKLGRDPERTLLPGIAGDIRHALNLCENDPSWCPLLRGPALQLAELLLVLDEVLERPSSEPALQLKKLVEEMDSDDPNFQGPDVAYAGAEESR